MLISSRFVSDMLKRGEFVELPVADAQPNDIIFYFSRDVLKHAGQLHSVSPQTTVRSKWGGGEIHVHPLWSSLQSTVTTFAISSVPTLLLCLPAWKRRLEMRYRRPQANKGRFGW